MKPAKWIKDSFPVGLLGGSLSLVLFYFLLTMIRILLIKSIGNSNLMRPPTVLFLTIIINVILFRILLINLEKEKTAKGLFFITVIGGLSYYIYMQHSEFARAFELYE
jgi:hypothetical protein